MIGEQLQARIVCPISNVDRLTLAPQPIQASTSISYLVGACMSLRPDLSQVSSVKLLEAIGRASGLPFGVLRMDPAEVVFANPELEEMLQRAGVTGPAAQASWLLGGSHPADGYEIHTADLGSGMQVVTARLAPGTRLEQLIDKLVRRYGLSASEHKELRHLARGLAIKDSARELGLSPETVRVRRKRVYRKMGLGGHEALLARICQEALLAPNNEDASARAS